MPIRFSPELRVETKKRSLRKKAGGTDESLIVNRPERSAVRPAESPAQLDKLDDRDRLGSGCW